MGQRVSKADLSSVSPWSELISQGSGLFSFLYAKLRMPRCGVSDRKT